MESNRKSSPFDDKDERRRNVIFFQLGPPKRRASSSSSSSLHLLYELFDDMTGCNISRRREKRKEEEIEDGIRWKMELYLQIAASSWIIGIIGSLRMSCNNIRKFIVTLRS